MRFESPIYLTLLLLIPLMFFLRVVLLKMHSRRMRLWGSRDLLNRQMPDQSRHRPFIKFCLAMGALALLIVMMARPQMGTKISNDKRNGIEAIICLDVSNSMMAQDVTPSRLDKSKLLVQNLVEHFNNDKIGLVVFAGDAFTQLPITSDYISAKMFLQNANCGMIQEQGTDIGRAIDIASQSFTKQDNIGRAIIVITDGENHEEGALEAAKDAKSKGMQVFILGVGSSKGAPIPNEDGTYMTDNSGQTVMTKLNEDMCRQIAEAGQGRYIHVDNTNEAQHKLDEALANMQRSETSNVIYSEYGEQFQVVGAIVIILLIIEILTSEKKTKLQKSMRLFQRKTPLLLLGVLVLSACSDIKTDRDYIRSGNKAYRNKEFDKALGEYEKAKANNKDNAVAYFNSACTSMQICDTKEQLKEKMDADSVAVEGLLKSAGLYNANREQKGHAYHNVGIVYHKDYYMFEEAMKQLSQQGDSQNAQAMQQGKIESLQKAIDAYKASLRCNPKDEDSRYNLALCQYLLKKEQKDQQQNQDQQKNDDKKDQDKDKDKDNKDKDKDDNKDKDQNQQQKQNQQQNDQMSKENAQQLLQAARQQEQQTQQRLKRQAGAAKAAREKNW